MSKAKGLPLQHTKGCLQCLQMSTKILRWYFECFLIPMWTTHSEHIIYWLSNVWGWEDTWIACAAYHNTMVVPNRNFILESWIPGIPVPDMFLSIGMPACRLEGAWLMPPTITRRIKRELLQCHSSLFFTTHRKRIAVSTVEPRLKGLLPYSFKSHGLSSTHSDKKWNECFPYLS